MTTKHSPDICHAGHTRPLTRALKIDMDTSYEHIEVTMQKPINRKCKNET